MPEFITVFINCMFGTMGVCFGLAIVLGLACALLALAGAFKRKDDWS